MYHFVFTETPVPVDNGAKSTLVALLTHLAPSSRIRLFLVSHPAAPLENTEPTREWCRRLGVDVVFLRLAMEKKIKGVPGPAVSWLQSYLGPDRDAIARLTAEGLGADGANVIFFCLAWNPMAFRLAQGFPRSFWFASDSIALWHKSVTLNTDTGMGVVFRFKAYFAKVMSQRVEAASLRSGVKAAFFVSPKDAAFVRDQYGTATAIAVVPLGINPEEYERRADDGGRPNLLFTGVMDYLPNKDAAKFLVEEVMPLLEKTGIVLKLVGKGAETSLAHLARPSVEIVGWVPSLAEVQLKASLFVSPLRMGAGAKNKVLQSLAAGVPVVGTAEAFSGFEPSALPPGAFVCESAEEFSRTITSLLADRPGLTRLGDGGRAYILSQYSWAASAARLKDAVESAVVPSGSR